ncbi:MAG: hypothetical protein LUH15_08700 [Tannerellaceae bacterium]|nr:hypothetical protein [Tannerellaceae bacterium]
MKHIIQKNICSCLFVAWRRTLFIFHFSFFTSQAFGQQPWYALEDDWEPEVIIQHDTIVVYDTLFISNLEDVTRIFKMTFQDFSKHLLSAVSHQDSVDVAVLEQIYLNYMVPMYFPTFLKHRYIYRNYKVEIENDHLSLNEEKLSPPLPTFSDSLQLDALLTCRGEMHTDYFLKSPLLKSSCLEQLFLNIHQSYAGKIRGVNLYFPDFAFKEKKALAQFVKSANLVRDSCKMKSIRDMSLYVTLDKEAVLKNISFLYALTQEADSIFLVDTHSPYWTTEGTRVYTKEDAKKSGWLTRMQDQFYLARFDIRDFPETDDQELTATDLRKIIFADYPNNHWEIYLFILIVIFVLLIVIFILFRYVSAISTFIYHHLPFVSGLLFMLVFEVCILFVCMVENMTNEQLFTLEGENINGVLFIPLIFIFSFPILKALNKRQENP